MYKSIPKHITNVIEKSKEDKNNTKAHVLGKNGIILDDIDDIDCGGDDYERPFDMTFGENQEKLERNLADDVPKEITEEFIKEFHPSFNHLKESNQFVKTILSSFYSSSNTSNSTSRELQNRINDEIKDQHKNHGRFLNDIKFTRATDTLVLTVLIFS